MVRVDDDVGLRQLDLATDTGGQVVIGHQNLQTQRTRLGHALKAGDAVVHGDQQVGTAVLDALRDRRCQAVAILHPVRHDVADVLCTEQAQAAHPDGAGGGTITVIVGDDADSSVQRNRVSQ